MKRIQILIVDDDPGHLSLLGRVIGDGRPQVDLSFVRDRAEFNDRIRNAEFDCVVTDFHLTSATAEELLRDLRRVQPDCPAIVISGNDSQEVVVQSLRNGGWDFVHKDQVFEGTVLWDRIGIVLAKRRELASERRKQERRERRLLERAETDELTGLANRRWAHRLFSVDKRKMRDRRGSTAAIMLDIDHFKQINDTYGHPFGDQVLIVVAHTIRALTTPRDVAMRWGGEEFLIIRQDSPFAESVRWSEMLRGEIERLAIPFNGQSISATASLGIAHVPSWSFTEAIIARADEALYLAKRQGRNRVVTWEMVGFEQLVRNVGGDEPGGRLHGVLQQSRNNLGPTQFEHLTLHSHRASRSAAHIARTMRLAGEKVDRLRVSGVGHDVPDSPGA